MKNKMKREIFRHGDMVVFKVNGYDMKNRKPNNLKKLKIGLGEITGHSHDVLPLENSKLVGFYEGTEVTEDDIANMDNLLFEVTGKGGVLVHEEHNPIYLEPGMYLRTHQVEFNPFKKALEKVRD